MSHKVNKRDAPLHTLVIRATLSCDLVDITSCYDFTCQYTVLTHLSVGTTPNPHRHTKKKTPCTSLSSESAEQGLCARFLAHVCVFRTDQKWWKDWGYNFMQLKCKKLSGILGNFNDTASKMS